jgi:thioredoxin 1
VFHYTVESKSISVFRRPITIKMLGCLASLSTRTAARRLTTAARLHVVTRRDFSLSQPARVTFTVQDEDEFKTKVMESQGPVIVDFSATWCGPCKLLTPRLDAAIAATEGTVDLAIVDIDDLGDIAIEYGVNAVPTVIGINKGKVIDRFVGLADEDKLGAFIAKVKEA